MAGVGRAAFLKAQEKSTADRIFKRDHSPEALAEKAALKVKLRRVRRNRIRANWDMYVLVAAPVLLILIFSYGPMYGNVLAFQRFIPGSGMFGSEWIGFENFTRFFNSYKFAWILKNTFVLNIYFLVAGFPAPIILALLIHYCPLPKYKKTVQMTTYIPHFISTVVMVGIIFKLFTPKYGIIATIFDWFGMQRHPQFLASVKWFPHVFVWTGIWQNMGWGTIIYLAALSAVDESLHDTAKVDGANIWRRMWHIDIKTILPIVVILLILRSGSMLQIGFEKIFLMQNNLNIRASEVISTYVYKIGLASSYPQYSYAAAIGLFQNGISFVLLVIVNRIAKKLGDTSLW